MEQTPKAAAPARGIFDESRPLWQVMGFFLVPLVLSNILQSASGTISSVFIGRLIGVNGLAAISAFFPVLFLLVSFLIGLQAAAPSSSARPTARATITNSRKSSARASPSRSCSAACAGILGALFTKEALLLLGTPANILADSVAYARLWFFAAANALRVLHVSLVHARYRRQHDAVRLPTARDAAQRRVTVPAFILGWFGLPHLGVVSASAGALLANAVSLIAMLVYLRVIHHPLALDSETVQDLKLDWPILKQIVRIGVPTGIQLIMVSLSELAVISFVNRFGSHATAAYGAVNQIASYVQFPAVSIGITASIFGAQAIGANREDLLRKVVRSGVLLNYVVGGVLISLCYIFKRDIAGWFLTDPGTLEIAVRLLSITLWSYLLFGNSAILSGIMRASGTVFWPTLIGIAAIWGVEVPVAYVLSHRIGIDGIWWGYPAAFTTAVLLQYTYYTLVWKRKRHERLI